MRINESGILVIEFAELVPGVMTSANFNNLKHRRQIEATRACKGKPAEIVWSSLPPKYQDAFIKTFGNPTEVLQAQALEHYLKPCEEAREYYRGFITGNHLLLPAKHIDKYSRQAQWLEVAICISEASKADLQKRGFENRKAAYEALFKLQGYRDSGLPTNYSKLCGKVRAFLLTNDQAAGAARNYGSLVSEKFGNRNTLKIAEEQSNWLIAHYSNPALKYDVNRLYIDYNMECERRGWKKCENPVSLQLWLGKPENKKLWWGAKYGEQKGRTKYSYVQRTAMPTMRDSLWYSDGTKLNFFDADGKLKASYTVYEVIDAYSEALLGCSIVHGAENFQAQYTAYKMAIQVAGHKPYEIRYDNQGGHKLNEAQNFFNKIARLNIRTMPYNGRSKSIESVFGRFQVQIMSKHWFYTGQNITAKRDSSKANRQFIEKHQKHLPTIDELLDVYIACRDEWNSAIHPKLGKPRIQLYQESVNPETPEVTPLDMVDLFWYQKPEPITYWNHGLALTFGSGKTKRTYEYEVLTADGMPDEEFRANKVMAKFIVKYDPENMGFVRLYEPGTMRFVAIAQPRIVVQRNIQEQKPGDRAMITKLLDVQKRETKNRKQKLDGLYEEYGIQPDEIVANGGKKAKIREKQSIITEAELLKEESYYDEEHQWLEKT